MTSLAKVKFQETWQLEILKPQVYYSGNWSHLVHGIKIQLTVVFRQDLAQ